MRERKVGSVVVVMLALCLSFMMSACGSTNSYAGTYIGDGGSILTLKDDGTCLYKDGCEDGTVMGYWNSDNDRITVIGCCEHNGKAYDIYADIDSSSTSLFFESDSSHWNDEEFVKND